MGYRNPIIPGFHPDPSVCRVGDDYYLVTSSFAYFPGVPIYHSKDLVNWRQLGHCLTRPSQLNLSGAGLSSGIWAPTIRHHAGTFYMITTNMAHGGNFIVAATDPAGAWSEPIWIDADGWDPSLFFDDDGTVYYQRNGKHGDGWAIVQSVIDPITGKLHGAPRLLWEGTGGFGPEAPHLYKIGGVYYLLIAEGCTHRGHMATLARSRSPWGPWEPCPHNPILTARDHLLERVQALGHGDLVEAHDGSWWMVALGIRNYSGCAQSHHHLGRETFLAPVTWEGGWPVVNGGRPVREEMDVPTLPLRPWPADEWTAGRTPGGAAPGGGSEAVNQTVADISSGIASEGKGTETATAGREGAEGSGVAGRETPGVQGAMPPAYFRHPDLAATGHAGGALAPCWNALRNLDPATWSLTERPGWLTLHGTATTLDEPKATPTFIGRRQEHFEMSFGIEVDFDPAADGQHGGLTVYMDHAHHYDLVITRHRKKRVLLMRRKVDDFDTRTYTPLPPGPVRLELTANPWAYTFSATDATGQHRQLGHFRTHFLSTELAGGFTGVYIALSSQSQLAAGV